MEEKILKEVKQIRVLLSQMLGTNDLPARQKFSKEAITKAAKEFRTLEVKRGKWITRHEIPQVIKNAPWDCSKVILEQFEFLKKEIIVLLIFQLDSLPIPTLENRPFL